MALLEVNKACGRGEGAAQRKRDAMVELPGLSNEQKMEFGVSILGDSRKLDYSSKKALGVALLPDSARGKAGEAKKEGISSKDFLAAYEAQKDAKGDKGRNGTTIELSASRNKKAAIDAATPGMSADKRKVLYELFDVSKQVWNSNGSSGRGLLTYGQWAQGSK